MKYGEIIAAAFLAGFGAWGEAGVVHVAAADRWWHALAMAMVVACGFLVLEWLKETAIVLWKEWRKAPRQAR